MALPVSKLEEGVEVGLFESSYVTHLLLSHLSFLNQPSHIPHPTNRLRSTEGANVGGRFSACAWVKGVLGPKWPDLRDVIGQLYSLLPY